MSRNYDKHSLEEYNLAMQLRKKYNCGTKRISEYLSNLGFKVKEGD